MRSSIFLYKSSFAIQDSSIWIPHSASHDERTMGVTKEILAEGSGATPTEGANVTVHCTGYGKDSDLSKKFWRCVHAAGQRRHRLLV